MKKSYNEPKLEKVSFNVEEKIMNIELYNAEGNFGYVDSMNVYPDEESL